MANVKELSKKTVRTLKNEGAGVVLRKAKRKIMGTAQPQAEIYTPEDIFKDVLFINGCDASVPHPTRYRVTHQREQLEAHNISTAQVFYADLQLDQVRFYRTFIFFRCPYTDVIGEFIKTAKQLNKRVLFDIDDLVVDTKYTDTIPYLSTISKAEKELYDDGVRRMGRTLSLCDAAITTTERLAAELGNYVPEVFINRNTASDEMYALSENAWRSKMRTDQTVGIGYFSGSLTHNDDFLMILPALQDVMKNNPDVRLHVVGELNLPEELKELKSQVIAHPFVDWRKLPELIAKVDINIAPLEGGVFNESKSENKWVEAALVKVPTIASNVGAFARMIDHNNTGLLCDDVKDWKEYLTRLVIDKEERERIADNAYHYCKEHCVTLYTGMPLAEYVKKYMTENYVFALPSLNISGGIMVAFKHMCMLKKKGYDVLVLNDNEDTPWCEFEGERFPVLGQNIDKFCGKMDHAVATMWTTLDFVQKYYNIEDRRYLVQGYETDLYPAGIHLRGLANRTYRPTREIQFLTISKWCQRWLKDKYRQDALYAPNGMNLQEFNYTERSFKDKIRILIEGDCAVDYKNVDEAFRVVNELSSDKYEIWYMSYNAEPKIWYRVDKFLHKVPYSKVHEVYEQCDILLKTSLLESFSYPPIEMMATGGCVVAVPNGGNAEYLVNEENCLLYEAGKISDAVSAIERISKDNDLRVKLSKQGRKTAESRDWKNIESDILKLYMRG